MVPFAKSHAKETKLLILRHYYVSKEACDPQNMKDVFHCKVVRKTFESAVNQDCTHYHIALPQFSILTCLHILTLTAPALALLHKQH